MRHITGPHEPTPEFRARLEREIVTTFRADAGRPLPFRGRRDWLRTAAIVLVALVTGAAGGVLSAQVGDTRERDRLLAAERAEMQLDSTRVRLERAQVEEIRRRVAVGIAGREALAAAEAELMAMETRLARTRLNLAEIEAAARAPRDDVIAPLVARRDFVRARLEVELALAQKRLTVAEAASAEARRRHEVGIAPRLALLESEAELARAKSEMELLIARRELRGEFLERNIAPAEVARRLGRLELEQRLRTTQSLRANAAERLEALRRMRAAGGVQQVEVLRAELEASERAAEVERIQRDLEVLERSRR